MPAGASSSTPQQGGMVDAVRRPFAMASLPWALLALLAGLLLTGEMARRELAEQRQQAAELRKSLAEAAQARLHEPFAAAAVALRSMQTVFLATEGMDQARFDQYQRNLLMGQMVNGYVLTGFARRHEDPAAPGRPLYRYEFISPMPGNEVLLGFDIARQPENLKALLRSRDTGVAVASMPFELLQFREAGRAAAWGITVRVPAYSQGPVPTTVAERHARELGALAVSMRLEPLVREALAGRIGDYMHVRIRDVEADKGQDVVYASAPLPEKAEVLVRRVDFGGRPWEVTMWPRARTLDLGPVWLILAAGTSISVLLALFLWSQISTHRRALAMGHSMSLRFGESEARFRVLNELLPALVLLAGGRDGRITYANQTARRQLGNVAGMQLASLFVDTETGTRAIKGAAELGSWNSREPVVIQGANGRAGFWANASLAHVQVDAEPHLLMVATDISAQRAMTEQLRYQAAHDELTGLCNRREFERLLRQQLSIRADDPAAPAFALLYIDLDQFKLINDLSGHMAGDQLLVQLVHAMRREMRDGDVLARLGGDEFGVLAPDVEPQQADALAERLRRCIEGVIFQWHGRTYTTSASIGLVVVDGAGCTLKDLLAWADSACYQAKENGRNRVCWYRDDADATRRIGEMEWTNRMRWALQNDRLLLDYQEVTELGPDPSGKVHIELLLRMRDEDGNVVAPGAFLSAVERYGLMPTIDRWVIRTALANFHRLHPRGGGLGTCAINLSGASIEDEGLADFILGAIDEYRVPPQSLCLEITETVAVRDLDRVVRVVERLRAVGCRIALDDFGAGMSSFGYLKNLPIDVIKIDGSFVRDLGRDPMSHIIVEAVARIGHQRGLRVVAEWVDSEATVAVLRELGVDYAQGFALHRPERVVFQRGQ